MPHSSPTVSLIFSFRNEQDVIPELLRRTRRVFSDEQTLGHIRDYELIFVNDDSCDHSLPILLKDAAQNTDLRVITMARNFGVTPCVLAGMSYASGDVIVYMDADLQDPPELIPRLLEKWRTEPDLDVVHTVRKSRDGEPVTKLLVTKVGYYILNRFSSVKIPMEAGDFKLLSRRAVSHLLQFNEIRPFLRGMVCWIGFRQAFVEYERQARHAGQSKFPIFSKDVLKNFFESALISFSTAPLRLATMMGAGAIVIDFLIILHALGEKFQGRAVPGWTALMISVLFLGGMQLLCLGIIGLYIGSIHEQGQRRPSYIIKDTYGFPRKATHTEEHRRHLPPMPQEIPDSITT